MGFGVFSSCAHYCISIRGSKDVSLRAIGVFSAQVGGFGEQLLLMA
jgi:hypothetical protein